MLTYLGKIIEKRPWFVVLIVLLVTIGFGIFIPGLEFKTNFEDFAPDNEIVKANNRISDYFGSSSQIIFLFVDKQNAQSTITPLALKDQYKIQKELEKIPEINSSFSITTFLETVCLMEFNKTLENCTDEEIEIALDDLLSEPEKGEIKILNADDPNEPVDYKKSFFSKGKSVDSADIKNYYISKDNGNVTFSIEVYDLSYFTSKLKPSLSKVRMMEWYIGFENILLPQEYYMKYQIAARIQPTSSFWEIGSGFLKNIKQIIQNIKGNTLFSSYKKEVYLWLGAPGQDILFPMQLENADMTFDFNNNRINIIVPKKELGKYGIATQYDSFELPAKLSNFTAGIRYFKSPILNRADARVVVNTSFLFNRIEKLHHRPIRGAIVSRLLQKFDLNLDEISGFSDMGAGMFPNNISLSYIEMLWTHTDTAPDKEVSNTVFSMIPNLFSDLKVNALSFISKDYEQTKNPKASIIIVQLENISGDTAEQARVNNNIVNEIAELDAQFDSISVQATGEGIVSTQINDVTMEAFTIIGPSIFIIIICIIFLAFRKPSYVVLPILVFVFSTIWLFGTMVILDISFSIIAVALLPLNIGLGVEYSVNFLYNYRVEIGKGRTAAEAIRLSIKEVGIAIFLAWFTTFVAFLSFLTASLPPIRDFGIFLALGITYTFIITMTFLPALRYILDKKKKKIEIKKKKQIFSVKNTMDQLAQILIRHEKKVFLVTIIICLVMGTGISQLESGFSMEQFIPQDNPALTLFDKISQDFPYSSQDQEYILIEGDIATVKALEGISTTHRNMDNDQYIARKSDKTTKTESIYTIIQQALANNQSLISEFNIDLSTDIPKTDSDVFRFYEYLYYSNEYEMQVKGVLYKDKDNYKATIIRVYNNVGADSSGDVTAELETLNDELNSDLADYGEANSIVTGTLLITLSILKNMTESQIVSTIVCFILAAIMLSIIYRNPILGLIAMIPVTISIIWVLGTMYYIGYTLNVLTITVTCITIGVGIDYACYITERFRLTVDKTGDITKAVSETISRTGSAIFIAALSSMFGFGILAFAPIPPQQQFGIITAITLIYAFITSIIVLPLVLARWAKWRKKRKGYIVSPGKPKELEGISESIEYIEE